MESKKLKNKFYLLFLMIVAVSVSFGFIGDDKTKTKLKTNISKSTGITQGGKYGDSYRLNINNINLPISRSGIIGAVDINDPNPQVSGPGGKFGGHVFLFSSGFMLSGLANGEVWANGVASASLIENYVPGSVEKGRTDPNAVIYVIKATDEPFGESWQDWADAVELGADFRDGDGDGVYNPVDKNGNGELDPDEDAPDFLGDETVWCVYNDGVPAAQRTRFNTVDPLGIEIRQTVFAFSSAGAIGNLIFVRYRIKYVGLGNANDPEQLDDVYFGVWADPDLGFPDDDLVGTDVSRNAAYTYNNGPDEQYGNQPPAYMIDFFSGPAEYIPGETFVDNNGNGVYDDGIDQALDTAYSVRGQIMNPEGPVALPGARNLPLSSVVVYLNGFSTEYNDPDQHLQARNFMLGLTRGGGEIDPCTLPIGAVNGVDCATIDPRFMFSGDPVTGIGWIQTQNWDVRQMSNTGPFTLKKGEEKEIVVAYVVAQGNDHLDAITQARNIDDGAQVIFDNNFLAPGPPPAPEVQLSSSEDFIDIVWETNEQVIFRNQAETYDIRFGGFNVYAYQTFSTVPIINNQPNVTLVARYQHNGFINNLFKENGQTGGIEPLYPAVDDANKLDSAIYADPVTGKIRLRITSDPFTGGPLIKGKPYYFAVTSYGINYDALVKIGPGQFGEFSDYYLTAGSFVQEVENLPTIAVREDGNPLIFGQDIYSPPLGLVDATKISGASDGQLQYDVVNKESLTGDKYRVFFEIDSNFVSSNPEIPSYSVFWNLENTNTGELLVDNSKKYLYGSPTVTEIPTEGFIIKLSQELPDLSDELVIETQNNIATGQFFYLAPDMGLDSKRLPGGGTAIQNLNNDFTKADKLRRVEIRFDQPGKAYRYLNGFVGAAPPIKRQSYMYAGGVVEGTPGVNPADLAEIGQVGVGFVDVPFTAWVEDPEFDEKRQLTVGFLERKISEGGNPDGIWNPGTDVNSTGEYIFIFDAPYDPNGNQLEYQGNFPGGDVVWADLKGYTIPQEANASELQRRKASSHFFDVLYAVGINKTDENATFSSNDKFIIDVVNYPYTDVDVFEFQTKTGGQLTQEEEKSLFEKVNVFPNPLYGFNVATSYTNSPPDEPFVTFSNLPPKEVTIKIYSLSGTLVRTLTRNDPTAGTSATSPFLKWNLQNENGLRVASGLYIAIVSAPGIGEKILKFSIIMPQKQLLRF